MLSYRRVKRGEKRGEKRGDRREENIVKMGSPIRRCCLIGEREDRR